MADDDPKAGHETTDVHVRPIAWFGVALVVVVGCITVMIGWMDRRLNHSAQAWPQQPTADHPQYESPLPRLQATPADDLHQHLATEEQILHSYGWVDRHQGVIRIPIDQAMELMLQRGLPVTGTTMPLPGPSANPTPGGIKP